MIKLKDFQQNAVDNVSNQLLETASPPSTIVLSALTGAGKTVIAASIMERIYDHHSRATILWISDSPELNKQTQSKIEGLFPKLSGMTKILDSDNMDEILPESRICFLNTQKLSQASNMSNRSESQEFTWREVVTNTVERHRRDPESMFVVFMDEAHRGTGPDKEYKNHLTILGKFLGGIPADDEPAMPKCPLVIGISATPDNFTRASVKAGRGSTFQEHVNPEAIRESGLLKRTILTYTDSDDSGKRMGYALLHDAAKDWYARREQWSSYCSDNNQPKVKPILIVQVEDGDKTDIAAVIEEIEKVIGHRLDDNAIVHAFAEKEPIDANGRTIQSIPASEIQSNEDVQVVLFKTALEAGWDCPRAEVLMSFRTVKSETSMQQLLGRVLRTPLQRATGDYNLDSVSIYSLKFDKDSLTSVLNNIHGGLSEIIDTVSGLSRTTYNKNPSSEAKACFAELEKLTTTSVTRRRETSGVKMAREFEKALRTGTVTNEGDFFNEHGEPFITDDNDDFVDDAVAKVLIKAIDDSKDLEDEIEKELSRNLSRVSGDLHERDVSDVLDVASDRKKTEEEIKPEFKRYGKLFGGDAVQKAYEHAFSKMQSEYKAMTAIVVVGKKREVIDGIDEAAKSLVDSWRGKDRFGPVLGLPKYQELTKFLAQENLESITQVRLVPAESIVGINKENAKQYKKHLYVRDGYFTDSFNSWEQNCIDRLEKDESVIGWLRNKKGGVSGFGIPYRSAGSANTTSVLYPDFIYFTRDRDSGVCLHIEDPHNQGYEDSVPKARGYAEYVDEPHNSFESIRLTYLDGSKLMVLDMAENETAKNALSAPGAIDSTTLKAFFVEESH